MDLTAATTPFEASLINAALATPMPAHEALHDPAGRDLGLTGPSEVVDPLRRPVRGDLAHVRCAGRVFVPHYAVPMPHRVGGVAGAGGTALRKSPRAEGDPVAALAPGEVFNVLDIAGAWAWGQQGDDGYVGYVALAALEVL